jgi:hypothetical protein
LDELGLVTPADEDDDYGSGDGLGGASSSTVITIDSHWKASKAFRFMTANALLAVAIMHQPENPIHHHQHHSHRYSKSRSDASFPSSSSFSSLQQQSETDISSSTISSIHTPKYFIGTLSLSDLRHLNPAYLMKDPIILDLLYKIRKVNRIEDLPEPVACGRHATLREVMRMVLKRHVHRVWVVDRPSLVKQGRSGREADKSVESFTSEDRDGYHSEGGSNLSLEVLKRHGQLMDVVSLTNIIQALVWAKHVAGGVGDDE